MSLYLFIVACTCIYYYIIMFIYFLTSLAKYCILFSLNLLKSDLNISDLKIMWIYKCTICKLHLNYIHVDLNIHGM